MDKLKTYKLSTYPHIAHTKLEILILQMSETKKCVFIMRSTGIF